MNEAQAIKITENFFDPISLDKIKEYCDSVYSDNATHFKAKGYWGDDILLSVKNDILIYRITKAIDNEIYDIIYDKMKATFNLKPKIINFHYFLQESNISWHTDSHFLAGATVYLNRKWINNDGGYFVYQKHNEDTSIVLPKMNKCVFQSGAVEHATTPTFKHSPIRKSIQVFF